MAHGPSQFQILASGSRTVQTDSAYFVNREAHRGVRVWLNMSSLNAVTPLLTINVQIKDQTSGNYVTLLASAVISTVSNNFVEVYPGGLATANVLASNHIGTGFRVRITVGDADAATYSVTGEWLP